jgi:flagellar biosynthesis regulator FlaF
MKIEETITVTMEGRDRQKIIDFYNLVNEWIKDIEDVGAEENQLYADLTQILYELHNFLRDHT